MPTMGGDDLLPLLALRSLVLFPGTVMPVTIGRRASLALVKQLSGDGTALLVATQKHEDIEEPTRADLYSTCIDGTVRRVIRQGENRLALVLRGNQRRRITAVVRRGPFMEARSEAVREVQGDDAKMRELEMSIITTLRDLAVIGNNIPEGVVEAVTANRGTIEISDFVPSLIDLSARERASLLCELHLPTRRYRLLTALERQVDEVRRGPTDRVEK
jgi:ATP-dependent Lon protease